MRPNRIGGYEGDGCYEGACRRPHAGAPSLVRAMEKLRHQPEVIAESRLRSWRDPERFVDGYTSPQIRTASWTRLGGCAMGPARAARAAPREPAGRARDADERARRPRLGPARARLPPALRRRALVRHALRGRARPNAGRLRARRAARAVAC